MWKEPFIWAHNHTYVYCLLASSNNKEISVLLEAYFFCLFEKLLRTALWKSLFKKLYEPIITLILVAWWLRQNKKNSFCFNTDFFCYLRNLWRLEFSKSLWKEPSVNLRKLISRLDLMNCWWLKLRVNEPIIMLVLDTWWRNQNGSIFWILVSFFFVWENIDDLNSTLFLGGEEWPIRL